MRVLVTAFLLASVVSGAQTQQATNVKVNRRYPRRTSTEPSNHYFARKTAELDTPYALHREIHCRTTRARFAKVMCSAVFITGLDPDFAAENVGYFTAPS